MGNGTLVSVLIALLAVGCSSAPRAAEPAAGDSSGAGPTAGVLRGIYWSWSADYVINPEPDGTVSYGPDFKYLFKVFWGNGFVYTGTPKPTLDEMSCAAASKTCLPFSIDGDTIRIGSAAPVPLVAKGLDWKIGSDDYKAVVPQAGTTLAGTYQSYRCYWSTCNQVAVTFQADGRYTIDSFRISESTHTDVWSYASGGSKRSGTYTIDDYAIELTPDGGAPKRAFYFRDGTGGPDTIQIDDTWFMIQH